VTFVPAHTLPFLFPGKAVVTVHDLGYKFFPEAHPLPQRLYLDWTTRYSARRATLILADSQATANDLSKFYGTPLEKMRVVYPGVEPPQAGGAAIVRQKYKLPERYFLFIGTLQPRKNIARIVQAYAQWKSAHPNDEAGLVLAGGKGWLYDEKWTEGVDGVYLPGYIDESDKGALLAGAIALLFPTLYEGFGFPVIEAMHCGTPVIASNTSSLPELVGETGLLVDPLDVKAISAAMDVLTWNVELRNRLTEKGYAQAAKFTWRTAAEQTLSAIDSI
jgi:glycosyltransferase involved in cell wall biosynthesis